MCVYRNSLSSGSCNGFDFTQFQMYFDEHRRLRAKEQLYELRRHRLTVSDASVDTASTATSCPTAVTRNSEFDVVIHISQAAASLTLSYSCHKKQ